MGGQALPALRSSTDDPGLPKVRLTRFCWDTLRKIGPGCSILIFSGYNLSLGGVWRSLVAHLVWDQGVQGSNPCTPTKKIH